MFRKYIQGIAEHSGSIIDGGIATAACPDLNTLRPPADLQTTVDKDLNRTN